MTGQALPKFILVEDRSEDAKLFQIVMKEVAPNVHIDFFKSAIDFLAWMKQRTKGPDQATIILLDVNLPGMNGLECLVEIKTHPQWKQVPVVILTSSAAPTDIEKAYLSYANSYVQKPLEISEFRKTIRIIGQYWLEAVKLTHSESLPKVA